MPGFVACVACATWILAVADEGSRVQLETQRHPRQTTQPLIWQHESRLRGYAIKTVRLVAAQPEKVNPLNGTLRRIADQCGFCQYVLLGQSSGCGAVFRPTMPTTHAGAIKSTTLSKQNLVAE